MTSYAPFQILTAAELNASIDGLSATIATVATSVTAEAAARAAAIAAEAAARLVAFVPTIAALRALTSPIVPATVFVAGFAAAADGGGGVFWLNGADTTSGDNGGTIFVDTLARRWYRAVSGQSLNLLWFGGAGMADYAPALTAAYAVVLAMAATQSGATIDLPAGTLNFNSQVAFTYPAGADTFSLTLRGAGSDATILNWPNSAGLAFSLSHPGHSIHLLDMTLSTDSVNLYIGVDITQSFTTGIFDCSDLTRVTWRGSNIGSALHCWQTACRITGLCAYNVVGCSVWGAVLASVNTGIGFVCQGSASITNQISVIQNFSECQFTFLNECITYGDYLQGMSLSQCNFTVVTNGIHQKPGSGVAIIGAQLAISGCQFACTAAGVLLEGKIGDVSINGSLFYSFYANAVGVFFSAASNVVRVAITGNMFEGNNSAAADGFVIAGSAASIAVSGNAFYGLTTSVAGLAGSTVSGWTLNGNRVEGIGVANVGINFSGAQSYAVITGNAFASLGTAVVLGAGTSQCNVQANVYQGAINTVTNSGTANLVGVASA